MEKARWKVGGQKENGGRKSENKVQQKSAYWATQTGPLSSVKADFLLVIVYRDDRGEGGCGGVGNVDCVIRLASSVSVGAGAICWAAGLQQTLPKFHSLLLIRLLIKEQSYWPSHRDVHMHMYIKQGEAEREKIWVQFSSS